MMLYDVRVEYRHEPIGIDASSPRFSWKIKSSEKNTVQESYSIRVTELAPSKEKVSILWDTGIVNSDKSVLVKYEGEKLKPRTLYGVEIAVTDNHGEKSETQTCFETGLMYPENMDARWITVPDSFSSSACPVFTRRFETSSGIVRARIYASALGIYEMALNGEKVGDAYLTPGWTNYHKRIQYQTYDVTDMISSGSSNWEITVADGWYKGPYGVDSTPCLYGTEIAVIAELHIDYADGSSQVIKTGSEWDVYEKSIRYSEIYMGEVIDSTFTGVCLGKAKVYEHEKNVLISQENEYVKAVKRISYKSYIVTPKGEKVIDFGQNLAGFVEFRVRGEKGQKITLRHAETLDKNKNFYTENLRNAKATDVFICDGTEQIFSPHFTYHGFRYISIEGMDEVNPGDFTAVVLHTDMEETGSFRCSDESINRLQQNIQWGERSNFVDIPTDCPQRDERMGWTGDAQVFCKTASFNMNTALFFTKWLHDLKSEQTMEFGPPHVVPNIWGDKDAAAAWSDAATIVPWTIYREYGDERLLSEQYDSMKDYVDYITANTNEENGLWQYGFQYADWLALDKEECSDRVGATDIYLVANAFYAHSAMLVSKAAEVLGKDEDHKKYLDLHNRIVRLFQDEYTTKNGRLVSDTQTGLVLALHFDLVKKEHRDKVICSLKENINRHGDHLTTGFVGTPYICHALSDNGLHDLAGKLLLNDDFPSWLYSVKMGATTIWERWNSVKPDGSFDESGMNSLNHYAYGSIGSWMYEKLAGIQLMDPGYKKFRIAPRPVKGIKKAEASLESPYGLIKSSWQIQDGRLMLDILVPANTEATVVFPGCENPVTAGSGEWHYESDPF